jgi:hypothetical protein
MCQARVTETILNYADIDTRRMFGVSPRRLAHEVISNLESKLMRHVLFYLESTKTILNFNLKSEGCMAILRPMILDTELDGLYMFNMYEHDWSYELINNRGEVFMDTMKSPWCTELKMKIIRDSDETENTTGSA